MVQANTSNSKNPQIANHNSPKLIPLEGNQKIENLRETLQRHSGEKQLIILQDFPDPDALSSAWAYKLIAQQYNINCDIIYWEIFDLQVRQKLLKLVSPE